MAPRPRNIAILGSTGSIGRSALEVIAASGGAMRASVLTANSKVQRLAEQANQYQPDYVVVTDESAAAEMDRSRFPAQCRIGIGPDAVAEAVNGPGIDVVLTAIVGSAGVIGTWAAVEAGKTVALANKETLVMAGSQVIERAGQQGVPLLPVDSEHSALFQALQAGRREEVSRLVLTSSGGPFRCHTLEQLNQVTVDDALAHPTWDMGPKITVDSATMMNKALEIIEARWLFGFPPERIDVVVHPQSIVHSMVEFVDCSVVAQLSPPDMRLPIQYALSYPDRQGGVARRLDLSQSFSLEFEPPDEERFPALTLGREVAAIGGSAGAVLNAANEAAVARFLSGELSFTQIVPACRGVLEAHDFSPQPPLEELFQLDRWAREEVTRWPGC